jgi:hypothetical protein
MTLLLARCHSSSAQVVLNEVLYDPAGADGGHEFVELQNSSSESMSLNGFRLEFANGAGGPVWQVRWTGSRSDSVAAGNYFLIVDRGWADDISGQAEVALSLQNGPDAVRLVRRDGSIDLLGYGEPLDPQLSEGQPHPDVGSGQSLGRRPDGHDSDDNAADWVALDVPTPGTVNFARWAARVDVQQYEPPSLSRAGIFVVVTLHLTNTGLAGLPESVLNLAAGQDSVRSWLATLPAEQSRTLQFHWQPSSRGRHALALIMTLAEEDRELVLPLNAYQVGQDDVYLSEVMAAPPPGGCEWVEVGNGGTEEVQLGELKLKDEDGNWRDMPAVDLAAGELVVLVQDRDRFQHWLEQIVSAGSVLPCPPNLIELAVHELPGAWPSLNNTVPADRSFADRVYLGNAAGGVVDHVILGAFGSEVPAGRSLERIARIPPGDPLRNWQVATSSLGATPVCMNSVSGPQLDSESFTLLPNPFRPTGSGPESVLHLRFVMTTEEEGWDARIFDLWGHAVRDLGGDRLGPGARDVLWDGRDDGGNLQSEGAYIILLRTYNMQAQLMRAQKRLAVIDYRSTP